jgi:SAM-dependent methyltransferase
MNRLRRVLRSLHRRNPARSIVKAVIPSRYHQRIRAWFKPVAEVQWCRVVMNREIERFIRSLDCPRIDALEISGSGSQGRYNFQSYQAVQYPNYDVCKEPLARGQFDLVIAEQVFEHILAPARAATHVYEMLRPGGTFVISTPFLLRLHEEPLDLYRWTERGMRELLETAGFTVIATSAWGRRECLLADTQTNGGWTQYDPLVHSLENEPQLPIVIWAFARKQKPE